ncbi:hypothetical protein NXS19_012387 [Fusarium pseudograminearum]|nr:hypothetical protein NXS19_012387 [Fusarium pseudograminearum]
MRPAKPFQNDLTERFDRAGMKFLPVRSEERLKWTPKERKFRISDERQIDLIVLNGGQFSIMAHQDLV